MRGAYGVLVRLRLFPHRTLLDRRGVPGRAMASWLAHPLRHDRFAWRHGAVLCRGCRACHDAVAAGPGPGVRLGDSLRPRRVRPRPYSHWIALESLGLRACRHAPHDAGGRPFRRLCLEPLGGITLRQSLRHLGAARLRARAVQRHCVADARLLCCACARRGMGRGAASERRYGEHRRAASHRAG